MSYTHYWTFNKTKTKAADVEKAYQRAIRDIHKIVLFSKKNVVNLAGFTAHTKVGAYGGIDFNGVKDDGHENFYLREHFSQGIGFHFCKTARKQYDIVVTAALIVLKHRLKGAVDVSSDGWSDDWEQGLELAKLVLKLKTLKIPPSIAKPERKCESCGNIVNLADYR